MGKATRTLAMAGMALIAGATLGAGPAAASTSTGQGATTTTHAVTQTKTTDRIVGYYRSRGACERVGRIGEWQDRWEDYDCDYSGWRHGFWVLSVDYGWGNRWGNGGWNHRGGDWDHGRRDHRRGGRRH